jgi:predicted O-methyltransferase YrrM
MSNRTLPIDDRIYEYLVRTEVHEPGWMKRLRRETAALPDAAMQIGLNQGKFLAFLVRLTGSRMALEIGAYTGMSACWIAGALPPGGRLICIDSNVESTTIARKYWLETGLGAKIELRLGDAVVLLEDLLVQGKQQETFDFIFVDANKPGYDRYYEMGLELLRPGGLILLDNALWDGRVADMSENDPDTVAIRAINLKISNDERVTSTLATIGDGLMIVMKNP